MPSIKIIKILSLIIVKKIWIKDIKDHYLQFILIYHPKVSISKKLNIKLIKWLLKHLLLGSQWLPILMV